MIQGEMYDPARYWELGETMFADQSANLSSVVEFAILGKAFTLPWPDGGNETPIVIVACKNLTSAALNPREIVLWGTTAGDYPRVVRNLSSANNSMAAGVVDPWLATNSNTVPVNDLFWLQVAGLTTLNNSSDGALSASDLLITTVTDNGKCKAATGTERWIFGVANAAANASATVSAVIEFPAF